MTPYVNAYEELTRAFETDNIHLLIKAGKIFQEALHICEECGGNGVGYRTWTRPEHAPDCDGYVCGADCPIPVEEVEYFECLDCWGVGLILKPAAPEAGLADPVQEGSPVF